MGGKNGRIAANTAGRLFGNLLKCFAAASILTLLLSVRASAGVVICLDPGHGGNGETGAGATYPPYTEKELNLELANKLKSELEDAGATVYLTRTDDRTIDLETRAAYAQSVGADYLISLHFNSDAEHDEEGTEVWISGYGDYHAKGAKLGSAVLKRLTALGLKNRGLRIKIGERGDYYGIIRNGVSLGIPTMIIEHCHLDAASDVSVLGSNGVSGFAHADAVGIIEYLRSTGELPEGTDSRKAANGVKRYQYEK